MAGATTVPLGGGCISASALVAGVARAPLREAGRLGATSIGDASAVEEDGRKPEKGAGACSLL